MHKQRRGIGSRIQYLEERKHKKDDDVMLFALSCDNDGQPGDPLACYQTLQRQVNPTLWSLAISELEELGIEDLFAALIRDRKQTSPRRYPGHAPWAAYPLEVEAYLTGYQYLDHLVSALMRHGVQADLPTREMRKISAAAKDPDNFRSEFPSFVAFW